VIHIGPKALAFGPKGAYRPHDIVLHRFRQLEYRSMLFGNAPTYLSARWKFGARGLPRIECLDVRLEPLHDVGFSGFEGGNYMLPQPKHLRRFAFSTGLFHEKP
jgi:hypothetical protein